MELIRAEPDDAPVLTQIAKAAKGYWGYPAEWLSRWENLLTVTPSYIETHPTFVALQGARKVGFCSVAVSGHEAWIDHLWVVPEFVEGGIGRKLFSLAETHAKQIGAKAIGIESDPNAEGFYKKMGAKVVGHQIVDMDGHGRLVPIMKKHIG